ncbi:oligosaccharide flippase family protein [Capnocytophaga sp. G2]|uniref:oligosaccharide flippase family protein n=1 Tax=Capnocytophaga sp. G2 TaxID=3110695 RepID=UPI002B49FF85|nr:oligosaccharide flippase family protein [Capnocytophaga sp. G2]MEB3004921.1 oligosaccharide flippase family protein [Capnocytophaga sp. G2]
MRNRINLLLRTIKNNKKVIENYFFMTLLLVLNSFFGLLIYPFIIRSLGKDTYGIFVFASTIVNYFIYFISFGFDLYGVRKISENPSNTAIKSVIVSKIFSTKIYLEIISVLVFSILLFLFPTFKKNIDIYIICFFMTLVNIFFPTWYFQGIQKMRVVSFIQLFFKILSLPFIFIYVKESSDLLFFTIIMISSSLLGSFVAFFYLIKIENLIIRVFHWKNVYDYVKESSYFFYTNIANMSKTETIKLIIGIKYGMGDLAIFDLAQKIISIPMILLSNINGALFPKIIQNFNIEYLKKILNFERLLGLFAIISVILLGKFAIRIFGGNSMELAYPLSIILSFTIFIFLQTGVYLYLILIPKGFDRSVLDNQIIAFISIMIFILLGINFFNSIFVLPICLVLSGIMEIIYLRYKIKKEKLLYNE